MIYGSPIVQIELPDPIIGKMEAEDLLRDLAVGMYVARHLTLGQAAKLASLSQGEFQKVLGRRDVSTHYDLDDLAQDLQASAQLSRG